VLVLVLLVVVLLVLVLHLLLLLLLLLLRGCRFSCSSCSARRVKAMAAAGTGS
jgi:hypothetical protein